MKILVTGGAGFLGSHLCEYLLKDGYKVICLDNCYTGSEDNIKHLTSNSNFQYIDHDVINPLKINCDVIYNLACPASPPKYQRDPIYTYKTSVVGVLNLLELAKDNGAGLLHASTSEVYGDPKMHPQSEDYWGNVNPIGPRSCYDEGKRGAETLLMDYYRQHQIDVRIARIFNTYGPKMDSDDGRVVSNFIIQALNGKPITIYGDGNQTRSFCYVDDMIEGLVSLMNSKKCIGPVNLGNPDEFTVMELANIITGMTNSKSKIKFESLPTDDPVKRKPNISLAEAQLGWRPKTDLQDGLLKTIEYFASLPKNTRRNT